MDFVGVYIHELLPDGSWREARNSEEWFAMHARKLAGEPNIETYERKVSYLC
jgi:hypothetical protein